MAVRIVAFRRIPLSRRSAWEKFYARSGTRGKGVSPGFSGVFRRPPPVGVSSTRGRSVVHSENRFIPRSVHRLWITGRQTGGMDRPPLAVRHDLQPHPEGGWYRQTWVAGETVTLPDGRVRPTATLIYFLLPAGESSAWHRVRSDEVWLGHEGTVVVELGGSGDVPEPGERLVVGPDEPQGLVPAGVWQRTLVSEADALVSCLVSPGFDFEDFELA